MLRRPIETTAFIRRSSEYDTAINVLGVKTYFSVELAFVSSNQARLFLRR